MRQVEWIEEGPLGSGKARVVGTLAELLTGGPYPSLSGLEVPPITVVNELLGGAGGGGMNGVRRWQPFTIGEAEYRELVDELKRRHGFAVMDAPSWVTSGDDWHVWLLQRRYGVPAEPHLRLRQTARDLARQLAEARADPTTPGPRLGALYLAAKRAESDADHFADPWLMAPGYRKLRRTSRWLYDAQCRQRVAELAGDSKAAAAAAAEAQRLRERDTRRDDQWPAEWEDWPEYPPPTPGR